MAGLVRPAGGLNRRAGERADKAQSLIHERQLLEIGPARPLIIAMALIIVFILGMANFVAHRAVMESGHPMLGELPSQKYRSARFAALAVEYGLLVAAMLAAHNQESIWIWVYGSYSGFNIAAAWMIATRRM